MPSSHDTASHAITEQTCGRHHSIRHDSVCTVRLHLSELIGMARLPDMQKIRIIGFFLTKIGYTGSTNFGRYSLQYVPASTLF